MEKQELRPNKPLRRERELRGWSQRAVAEAVGTTEQVVTRWESGQHTPNRHFQTALCQLFGKNAEALGFLHEPPTVSTTSGATDAQNERRAERPLSSLQQHTVTLRVWMLGRFRVERHTDEGWEEISQQEWKAGSAGSDARHLLQLLVSESQRTARRSRLIDELWPGQDLLTAEGTLSKAASKLRSLLGDTSPSTLLHTVYGRGSYQLAGQAQVWVDVEAAETLLNQAAQLGRSSEPGLVLLQDAVDLLSQGEFLAAEGAQWTLLPRGRIETLRTRCHLWLADGYEQQGALHRAEEQMEALLFMDPTDEAALGRLLVLLHRQGMKALALRRYQEHKRYLEGQGMALSSAVEALVQQIQNASIHIREIQTSLKPSLGHIVPLSHHPTLSTPHVPSVLPLDPLFPPHADLASVGREHIMAIEEPLHGHQRFHEAPFLTLQQKLSQDMMAMNESQGYLLSRRQALLAIAALTVPLFPTSSTTSRLDEEELLLSLKMSIDACWQLSNAFDIIAVSSVVSTYLSPLATLVRQSSSHRQAAAHLAAQAFLLKAIMDRHLRGLHVAEATCREAIEYSKIAGDPVLHLATLRHLAMLYYYAKRHQEELALYHRMQPLLALEGIPPLMLSFLYAGWAGSQAINGLQQEARTSLALARDWFPRQPETSTCPVYIDYDYSQLFISEGLTYYDLGSYQEALHAFLHVDGLSPKVPVAERGRLEFLNCQALTILRLPNRDREMQQCIDYWTAGIQGAINLRSRQRYDEACHIYALMEFAWPYEKKINVLKDLTKQW